MRSTIEKQQKLLLTTRETANALSLSLSTIRRYMSNGILPSHRIGGRRMLHVRDVVAFAENGVSLARLQKVREAVKQTSTGETENDI